MSDEIMDDQVNEEAVEDTTEDQLKGDEPHSEEHDVSEEELDEIADTAIAASKGILEHFDVGEVTIDEYEGDERMTRGVVVRHLMLPGALEDSKRVVQTVWEHFGSSVLLSIMNQYTPVLSDSAKAGDAWACRELERCPELARRVPDEDYERLLDFADSLGIEDYFWQEGGRGEFHPRLRP